MIFFVRQMNLKKMLCSNKKIVHHTRYMNNSSLQFISTTQMVWFYKDVIVMAYFLYFAKVPHIVLSSSLERNLHSNIQADILFNILFKVILWFTCISKHSFLPSPAVFGSSRRLLILSMRRVMMSNIFWHVLNGFPINFTAFSNEALFVVASCEEIIYHKSLVWI